MVVLIHKSPSVYFCTFMHSTLNGSYIVPLSVPCRNGRIDIHTTQLPQTAEEVAAVANNIMRETEEKGGVTAGTK